jgi:hypothetical protein
MPEIPDLVRRYLELGLALGRHIDGFVDAYYGPPELAKRAAAGPPRSPGALEDDAHQLLGDLEKGEGADEVGAGRRRWLAAQVEGLRTSAAILGGTRVGYSDEVAACYGVRPRRIEDDELAAAHRELAAALPGSGALADRYIAWREAQAVPVDKLRSAIASLAEDFRERTASMWGLPEGEHVDFDLVTNEPWAGFNYYLGDLRSRVVVNVDLPVLSTGLAALVAHESYPGHHTEHSRKEAGLVRRRRRLEETIFLVGTPQCLLAEGLADLGLEVILGPRPEPIVAGHLHPLRIRYDAEVIEAVAGASEALARVRGNAAFLLHEDGRAVDDVIDYVARWALLPRPRAEKAVQFLTDPTWRAYVTCYIEGMPLCRRFVGGRPERFARLITEQLIPADLEEAAAA